MIIAIGTYDGKPTLILGLSDLNIQLLKQGRPILKDISEPIENLRKDDGELHTLLIVWGRNEADCAAKLSSAFTHDMTTHVMPGNELSDHA